MKEMKKYTDGFRKKLDSVKDGTAATPVEPFKNAQRALARAEFTTREREEFFSDAYLEILIELFDQWIKTEPHAVKEREYLYHSGMALGSIKEKLIAYETFGKNAAFHIASNKAQEAQKEE